jgi:excisionase family DNA binding protein
VDPATPKLLLSPVEAMACLGIGRTLLFALLNGGEIASFLVGRTRKIPVSALEAYIERRCAEVGVSLDVAADAGAGWEETQGSIRGRKEV